MHTRNAPPRRRASASLEADMRRSHDMLQALTRAQAQFIHTGDPRASFEDMLTALLEITDSEYGFIGEVLQPPGAEPYLKTHAITNIAWNEETRTFYEREAPRGMEFRNLKTLFGAVISTGEPVVANSPYTDPRRGGLPEGHPPLNKFLGLPFHHGDEMVGMVGIANRPGGYDAALIEYLRPFLATCATVIVGSRDRRERAKLEAKRSKRHALMQLLFNVGAQTARDPGIQLQQALRWVTQDLGMAVGIVSRIDGDEYVVDTCDSPEDALRAGDRFPLPDTYCSMVMDFGGVVAIDHMADSIHYEHPCYDRFHLESYIGTQVRVHGSVFGTLNFSSPGPREAGWDEIDQEFIELLAIWVGSILERRIADDQLAENNREIRRMYHTLCHELKTPLTAVREFLSIIKDGLAGPVTGDQGEYLEDALQGCDELGRHIDDLVDVTRAETGKMSCVPVSMDPRGVLGRAEAAYQVEANDRQIVLRVDRPKDLPPVLADSTRIGQVLGNLIGNALKFTPAGGRVTVRVRPWEDNPEWSLWSVEDTGRGIEEDDLERIFDRLFQVSEDDWSTQGGLGLGLSICREIIRLHRGRIWAESELGKGARFHFTLPFAASA